MTHFISEFHFTCFTDVGHGLYSWCWRKKEHLPLSQSLSTDWKVLQLYTEFECAQGFPSFPHRKPLVHAGRLAVCMCAVTCLPVCSQKGIFFKTANPFTKMLGPHKPILCPPSLYWPKPSCYNRRHAQVRSCTRWSAKLSTRIQMKL